MTLSRRITFFSTGLVTILLLIVNLSVYALFKENLTSSELDRLANQAVSISTGIDQANSSPEARNQFLHTYAPENGMLRLVDANGASLITVTKNDDLLDLPTSFSPQETADVLRVDDDQYATASTPLIWSDGQVVSLQLTQQLDYLEETLPLLGMILLVASLVVFIPTFLASQALGRFILKPIRSLAGTMNEIRQQGTLRKVADVPTKQDELADLSHSFNHMIDLLQQHADQQQQFVSDASHELKTPLTVVESYAKLLERWGKHDPSMIDEAVDAILSESARMKALTEQMLLLAKGETPAHERTRLHINQLVKETCERMSIASGRPITFADTGQTLHVLGSEHLLKQLFFLLLDNGIKYSDDALTVTVERLKEEECMISVKDQGIGISQEEQAAIFKRFYRVDQARSRETGGSGLGLSIAKKIVEEHDGLLRLESIENHGSTFYVTLPLVRKEYHNDTY
ncbi:sensor histidine kinase [Shouchella lehensis]|uniref:Signal transduction histidine-protein kinase ArlS n=1 Tax=Shouchella lehensis G1 TaxID=1246626 RepID=A0A060M199_9BACI|nr:HAMP domain-containing histidine kinase [Shouchella lehensis]AIC94333.1 sensor histidine kinase ykoH [Shouchella lehensis G1]